jgi:hypothetical protein
MEHMEQLSTHLTNRPPELQKVMKARGQDPVAVPWRICAWRVDLRCKSNTFLPAPRWQPLSEHFITKCNFRVRPGGYRLAVTHQA